MTSPLLFRFRICRLFRTDKITGRSFVHLRGGKAIALPYRGCYFGGRVGNPVILSGAAAGGAAEESVLFAWGIRILRLPPVAQDDILGCGGAALPSPGEKVAERSEVGCGMRAITLRKQSGIILADGKFSAGLCDVEDPAFFPAFHLSQLR